MPRPTPFVHPVAIRYLEVDQQQVVFNMWYLAYLDDAMTAFLLAGGLAYAEMLDRGYDVQVVHTELDWHGSLRWSDQAEVVVLLARLGHTSFTLGFEVRSGDRMVVTASTVYVCVRTDGSGKAVVPDFLAAALGQSAS